MLVLTRKPGEEILIDHNIRLLILSAPGGGVRVCIDSPDAMLINHDEVNTHAPVSRRHEESEDEMVDLFVVPEEPRILEDTTVLPTINVLSRN